MNVTPTLILVVACFSAYVCGESHLVCKQMEEVFSSHPAPIGPSHSYRNRPGKRGLEGRKGEIGRTGLKGDQGIVRYDLVNNTLKKYISEYEREQDLKISNLEASLAAMNENLQKAILLSGYTILYNNKCYVPKTETRSNVAKGRDICAGMSGKLADIYDKAQMDYLMKSLRSNHMTRSSTIYFWTGMTINPQNGEVKLSDGRSAPYLRWHPGYPSTASSNTNIVLKVSKSPSHASQYMWNDPPSYMNYILCEI